MEYYLPKSRKYRQQIKETPKESKNLENDSKETVAILMEYIKATKRLVICNKKIDRKRSTCRCRRGEIETTKII
jgi:hypothetical protein